MGMGRSMATPFITSASTVGPSTASVESTAPQLSTKHAVVLDPVLPNRRMASVLGSIANIANATRQETGLSSSKPQHASKLKSRPKCPAKSVGGSSFEASVTESSVTTIHSLFGPLSSTRVTTDADITASFFVDYAEGWWG